MITDLRSPDPIPNRKRLRKVKAMNSESLTMLVTSQKAKDDAHMKRKASCIAHLVPILLMAGSVKRPAIMLPAHAAPMRMPISKLFTSA